MTATHHVFLCQKCKQYRQIPFNLVMNATRLEKQVYCFNCASHADAYNDATDKVKKKFLFDCFICGDASRTKSTYNLKLN